MISKGLQEIEDEYIKLLQHELVQIFGHFPTHSEISSQILIGKNTYSQLFNDKKVSMRILNDFSSFCEIVPYDTFKKRLDVLTEIKKQLVNQGGHWSSYRLDSTRRLYLSKWKFREAQDLRLSRDNRKLEKNDKNHKEVRTRNYVSAEKITFNGNVYKGEVVLGSDLSISIIMKSDEKHILKYSTIFTTSPNVTLHLKHMKYILFEVLYIEGEKRYTQLEIFAKESNGSVEPQILRSTPVSLNPDENNLPTNPAYLSFNYLTRYGSKSRRIIDNLKINTPEEFGTVLRYKHEIFISCPISYISTSSEFLILRRKLEKIRDVLVNTYSFHEKRIYCEILEYERFNQVPQDSRHVAFKVRKLIPATHYIAVVPEELKDRSSGIYMEIYFRIQNKLPGLVFVENRANLPSLLYGLMENPDRPVNIAFRDIKIEDLPSYLKKSKEYLFQYTL